MSNGRFELWRKILLFVLATQVVLGVALVFFDNRILGPPFVEAMNQAMWSTDAMPEEVVAYHRFVHAVLGATVLGWAVTMLFVVQNAFRRKERWAWWALFLGTTAWCVLDTGSSLLFGAWPNAVLNVCSYAGLLAPLLFTRSAFFAPGDSPVE